MKCKKIFAAVAALAMLSASVTGYAATVSTTTIYNGESGKVEVATAVTGATADSEVTYIVKSGSEIVYIDQDTADSGAVNFTYKIDKTKIVSGYSTSVKFGSSAESEEFSGNGSSELGIVDLQQAASDSHYTISYADGATAWGYNEKITATVVPDTGYEVTAIYINNEEQTNALANTVELAYGETLTAEVKPVVTDAVLSYVDLGVEDVTYEGVTYKSKTIVLKPSSSSTIKSVGVVYNGDYYESLGKISEPSAVRIIFPDEEKDYILTPAYKSTDSEEVVTVSDITE